MLTILAVSGGTGETAKQITHTAALQFEDAPVKVVVRGNIRTARQVRAVVKEAKERGCLILHTLVSDDLRRLMLTESRLNDVDAMDLLGPVLERLAEHLDVAPLGKPGLRALSEEGKSREIEAVDFAFRHDDGQRIEDLSRAEIVLVGVSRAMKTPTMLYLAYRGWFVANVPLILGAPPPEKLQALDRGRVFHLRMAPDRLLELRRVRARRNLIPADSYASMDHIRKELRYADRLCSGNGWRRVDVTGKSVEEVAREIISLTSGKKKP
jgi:regulator of PEP synthase PpsR (kinase-PPPase family)